VGWADPPGFCLAIALNGGQRLGLGILFTVHGCLYGTHEEGGRVGGTDMELQVKRRGGGGGGTRGGGGGLGA